MPVAQRQAWTAQQKLYAIELKRKSLDKKLDDIIVAVKANYDRDVSASTLHAWLKPENAAKIEQLVNASGHNLGGFTLYKGSIGLNRKTRYKVNFRCKGFQDVKNFLGVC
jgi:recombinational DNA repair protein RecR